MKINDLNIVNNKNNSNNNNNNNNTNNNNNNNNKTKNIKIEYSDSNNMYENDEEEDDDEYLNKVEQIDKKQYLEENKQEKNSEFISKKNINININNLSRENTTLSTSSNLNLNKYKQHHKNNQYKRQNSISCSNKISNMCSTQISKQLQEQNNQNKDEKENEFFKNENESIKLNSSPPSIEIAKIDLLKQLKLYLELCKMLDLNNQNKNINNNNNTNKSNELSSSPKSILSSSSFINEVKWKKEKFNQTSLNRPRLKQQGDLNERNLNDYEEGDDLEESNHFEKAYLINSNKMISNKKMNKLKPLISFSFYSNCENFIGREWLFKEIDKAFETTQVVFLSGQSGTGKTRLCQHLFQLSSIYQNASNIPNDLVNKNNNQSIYSSSSSSIDYLDQSNNSYFNTIASTSISGHSLNHSSYQVKSLASNLACAHLCSPDDTRSLETSQFIHNLAWSLINFDQFNKIIENQEKINENLVQTKECVNLYKNILLENNLSLFKKLINSDMSKLDSDILIKKCIIDPIESIQASNSFNFSHLFVIIDGLDYSSRTQQSSKSINNLSNFLSKNLNLFPKWFKFLITIQSEEQIKSFKQLQNYVNINLDGKLSSSNNTLRKGSTLKYETTQNFTNFLNKDLNDYILYRINKSNDIQKNILHFSGSAPVQSSTSILNSPNLSQSSYRVSTLNPSKFDSNLQLKFVQHLSSLSDFNYLYLKLTLDLIEKGNLVIKSSNFKVLPRNFDDLLKLYFNLKFHSRFSYDRLASHIFSLLLVSNRPLSLDELYEAINCSYLSNEKINLNTLLDQLNQLDDFITNFYYYDPDLDNLDQICVSNSLLKNKNMSRTSLYTFSSPSIRDWWFDYHLSQCNLSPKPIYTLEWGNFLLGIRLFRSMEFNQKLKGAKNFKILLDSLKYFLKSSQLINKQSDIITYLSTLYLPYFRSNTKLEQILTNLMTSSDFLSWPDLDLFKLLINLGADYNSTVSYYNNIPFACVLALLGYVDLIRELLNITGSKINSNSPILFVDKNGTNCLCYSTQYNQIECCEFIIENSTDPISMITQLDSNGYCALTYASSAKKDMLHLLNFYIRFITNSNGNTLNSIKLLIEQAFVLSSANSNKNCLIYLNDLIKSNPSILSIDAIDSIKGETALTVACFNGHKSICEFLVEKSNSSISMPNSKTWTPLLCAVKSGSWEIVEYLLNKNSDIINQADKHGRNALILAASEGHLAILDILIEKGANLKSKDRDGLSALSWACLKGHYNASLSLIENGVDINHTDHSGRTPLDLATFYGDIRLVQLLIEKGAQIEHVDKIGMRPFDRAIGCRNVPIVVCFLKKGAKLNPATWAMAQGKPEIIITLLNKLVEDGNTLYRKGNYDDALHRYSYTLKKFPKDPCELAIMPENVKAIIEMKFNLLLNLSRCYRKLQDYENSIELCTKAIELKNDSYEAFYSRARAKRDLKMYNSALEDLEIALKLCTSNNSDISKLISKINDEMKIKANSSTLKLKHQKNSSKSNLQQEIQQISQQQLQQQQTTPILQHQSFLIESPPL